jgi:HSP20 family protein
MTILKWSSRPDFERFFGPYYESEFGSKQMRTNRPATNIKKNEDQYEITMAVPGLQKDDFSISLDKNILTVSYEKKEENNDQVNSVNYLRREFRNESFSRKFSIPESTHIDNISARYENGILSLTIPVENPEKNKITKSIEVN